jgi:hypothetical protein
VTINSNQEIEAFYCGAHKQDENQYKTVNIYSLSTLTWRLLRERLDHHISNNMVDGYYETVFEDMVNEDCLSLTPVFFDANSWYEIDTIADLRAAEQVCGLHHPPAIITDYVANNPKGQSYPPAFKRLKAIGRIKRSSRHNPDKKVLAPTMPSAALLPH